MTEFKSYSLINENLRVRILNHGARITELLVKDSRGNWTDVVLGFKDKEYPETRLSYCGAAIGPYANRIANGQLEINDVVYNLDKNEKENTLHSGGAGFNHQFWNHLSSGTDFVELNHKHRHLQNGYPGELETTIRFELKSNELEITFRTKSDRSTHVSLTHHAFFNLAGSPESVEKGHALRVLADRVLELDSEGIPTGEAFDVDGLAFDFRQWNTLAEALKNENTDSRMSKTHGIDHNYIINDFNGDTKLVAELKESSTNINMKVFSNQPGLQVYTGNYESMPKFGKNGEKYGHRSAICLEPQCFPDSPNHEHFPSTLLKPEESRSVIIKYQFSTIKNTQNTYEKSSN